jgi:hypothetical protein
MQASRKVPDRCASRDFSRLKNLLTHAQDDVSIGTGQETTEGIDEQLPF